MNHFDPEQEIDGRRQIASKYHPLTGPYDSGDPHVLEYHLLLMKLAGIDGVIVDWYGLTNYRDYAVLHRNTTRLLQQCERLNMKFAICYEDQTIPALVEAERIPATGRVAHAVSEIDWLGKYWFKSGSYVNFDGKPVLLSFGHIGLNNEEWGQCLSRLTSPVAYFSQDILRHGAIGGFGWPSPMVGTQQVDRFLADSKRWPQAIPAAFPRFDDIYKQAGVSGDDQKTIAEYLDSVHAIEKRIAFAEKHQLRASQTPGLLDSLVRPNQGVPDDHGEYIRTMLDMIALAFWADATRVCTFMMDHGQSNRYFNFIDGVNGTWHALSHWKNISGTTEDDDGKTSWSSRDEKRMMYNRVTHWHTEQTAYLLGRLKSIKNQHGSLLDQTMVVYGSSLSDGHEHAEKNLPVLLAGGGSTITQGRRLGDRNDTSMSDLHLAMLQHLGIPMEQFAESRSPLVLASRAESVRNPREGRRNSIEAPESQQDAACRRTPTNFQGVRWTPAENLIPPGIVPHRPIAGLDGPRYAGLLIRTASSEPSGCSSTCRYKNRTAARA